MNIIPSSTFCKMHRESPLAMIIAKAVLLFMYMVTRSAGFAQKGDPSFSQNNYGQPAAGNNPSYQQSGFGPFPNIPPEYGQNNPSGQYPYSPGYGGNSPSFNSPPYGSGAGTGDSFYGQTCPAMERIVLGVMFQAVQNETRLAASILRLHFHDCFVNGCDASILLDDTPTFRGEKTAGPNNNSARGFEVIDIIKSQLETWCPGVVSCADILAIAARDSVVLTGGPSWDVVLGRKDSRTASFDAANKELPSPLSDVQKLNSSFQSKGLSLEDMVSLSGAHTIGLTRCLVFRQTLYNHSGDGRPDSTINTSFLQQLQGQCPPSGKDESPSPLDYVTPDRFDNSYFANLKQQKGVLHSDRTLYDAAASGTSTSSTVDQYSSDQYAFFESFKRAMIKMGNISPPPGTQGEIRRDCRKVN